VHDPVANDNARKLHPGLGYESTPERPPGPAPDRVAAVPGPRPRGARADRRRAPDRRRPQRARPGPLADGRLDLPCAGQALTVRRSERARIGAEQVGSVCGDHESHGGGSVPPTGGPDRGLLPFGMRPPRRAFFCASGRSSGAPLPPVTTGVRVPVR
jgi:hypothetical protein